MPAAEIFLSSILKVLLTQMVSGPMKSFVSEVGVGPKLKKWENMLKMIQAVIEDAEAKQLTKTDTAVKVWLGELQDLAYEMEDILDEFTTKALGRMLKAKHGSISGKVLNKIPDVMLNFRMWSKMNSITSRLIELSNRITALGLREISGETSTAAYTRPPTTSLVPPKPDVYGRDEDKAQILDMVLGDAPGDICFCVISVIGMGGIGKTTLAREVYNDESVVEQFGVRVWISVHEDFDALRISKTILSSVLSSSLSSDIRDKDLNQVQVQLKNELAGKMFLLVLDDVWSESHDLWELLTSPFTAVARGSKIIVTTRHKEVALVMGSHQHIRDLNVLSDDDCWSVFVTHVSHNRDISGHQNLKQIKEKVVKRCRGLPLAAKTLGCLLRSKSVHEWEAIVNSNLSDEDSGILPVLRLSYYHLPSHLKSCFIYCAILPKGYEFEEEELVLLWMAEGLCQPDDNMQPEALGCKYFRDLQSMSLFQQSSNYGSKFIMHDLVSDLAQWIAGETILTLGNELRPSQSRSYDKALHLSYTSSCYDETSQLEECHEAKRLRTLLDLKVASNHHHRFLSDAVLPSLLPKLKKLRVLSLPNNLIFQLPNSIGELRHLRYLNFSDTGIEKLPESIITLYNLQILMLRNCSLLDMLPSKIGNLISLRHLNIKGSNTIREMPLGMNELECLQTLSNFIVGKFNGSSLKDLMNLKLIGGELHISGLENTYTSNQENDYNINQGIGEGILIDKEYLEVLILEWGSHFDNSRNKVAEENVLDMLKPHGNLRELTIKCYGGTKFPSWVGDSSVLSSLTVLKLESCDKCESLPPLGLLGSLEVLTIQNMRGLKRIGSEIYGDGCCTTAFSSLKSLCFEDLQEWEHWDPFNENDRHVQIFSCLCVLSIVDCPKLLARVPSDRLSSLENLVIYQCPQLTVSVYNLPSFKKLKIRNCLELVITARSLPLLSKLEIFDCETMVCHSPIDFMSLKPLTLSKISEFSAWFMQGFVTVERLGVNSCEELMNLWQNEYEKIRFEQIRQPLSCFNYLIRELSIENCSSLISFPEHHIFSILNELDIKSCSALTSLPEGIQHSNARLQRLNILGCDSLTFIFRDQLPSSLNSLSVTRCEKLRCLFDDGEDTGTSYVLHEENISNTSLLEKLYVASCQSLTCLSSRGQLPVAIERLSISLCSALTTLSSGPLPTALKHLSVEYCDKLTTLSCQLPQMLEYLDIDSCSELVTIAQMFHNNSSLRSIGIYDCKNLESLPEGLDKLSGLQSISMFRCPSLVSFPDGGLPSTNLSSCSILSCVKLEALPNRMHNLNSLQKLSIEDCPSIISFPEEGFPTQLEELSVEGHNISQLLIQWGLHKLISLRILEIQGCSDAESFPQEEMRMKLPTSLTDLTIESFPELKELCSKGFQNLSSLKYLSISNCPNLYSFPKNGLPSSVRRLNISNCPKLKKRYKRVQWKKRFKIAHISDIRIDGISIEDSEEEEEEE